MFSSSFRHVSVKKSNNCREEHWSIKNKRRTGSSPNYELPQSGVKIIRTFYTLTYLLLARFHIKSAFVKMQVVSQCRLRSNYRRQVETSRNTWIFLWSIFENVFKTVDTIKTWGFEAVRVVRPVGIPVKHVELCYAEILHFLV